MDTNNLQLVSIEEKDDMGGTVFNFSHFFQRCIKKWYWIAASVFVCLVLASAYIVTTRPTYIRRASVLIKEAATRRMATSDLESVLSFSGGSAMSSKVVNEVIAFESPALMQEAVKRLNLTTDYFSDDLFRDNVIYATQVPVEVEFLGLPSNLNLSFRVTPVWDKLPTSPGQMPNSVKISKFTYTIKKDKIKLADCVMALGDTLNTSIGAVVVKAREYFGGEWKKTVIVRKYSLDGATAKFCASLKVKPVDMKNRADVLTLALSDHSVQRADDLLNTLINIYNENWVEDKNKMAISTSRFIDDRLLSLEKELGQVDDAISDFKSSNLVADMNSMSQLYMSQIKEVDMMHQELTNQLSLYKYIRNYIIDNPGTETLIPMSPTFAASALSSQIGEYNKTLLTRNNIRSNSSDESPIVKNLTASLETTRESILATFENQIGAINAQLDNLMQMERANDGRMSEMPTKTKQLLGMGRQQKVKEQLYLYLLQKREENELSQAFTAYNTRVITPPMGIARPAKPKKAQLLAIAFLLGLLIPLFVLYIIELLDNNVHDRNDLQNLTLPSLGEIPQDHRHKSLSKALGRKSEQLKPSILVKHGERTVINEAFRVLRTNLEFMHKGIECPVISVTSFNPGSGKTFISMNTAAAMAIKGNKVLTIDCDLRRSSLSEYANKPKKGISDYLAGNLSSVQDAIISVEGFDNLYMLPVGSVPPNPSELLGSGKFQSLIVRLKKEYDLIIIDCPPVDIVADTQIINDCVDRTMFVIRAGLMERKDVMTLQKYYETKRLKNLCYVFNGVENSASYYGRYGSYAYGDKHHQ